MLEWIFPIRMIKVATVASNGLGRGDSMSMIGSIVAHTVSILFQAFRRHMGDFQMMIVSIGSFANIVIVGVSFIS